VQLSFTLILWGLTIEPNLAAAFSASGSALSTLGFLTPSTRVGQYLAIGEAAIGLAIVVLLFTFVPGYQAAVQVRERKVGWLYARSRPKPTGASLLISLSRSDRIDDRTVWEEWEGWFRGVHETHSLAPILAYVPSIYRDTSWIGTAAAVLDAASLVLSTLDSKQTHAVRLCRETGVTTLRLMAAELHGDVPDHAQGVRIPTDPNADMGFDQTFAKLAEIGLPVKSDKEACRVMFATLRREYEQSIRNIAQATLMPVTEPWVLPHADRESMSTSPERASGSAGASTKR
jgi:hypothetical protein